MFLLGKTESSRFQQPTVGLTRNQQVIRQFDRQLQNSSFAWSFWNEAKTLAYILVKRLRDQRFETFQETKADIIYCSQQLLFAKLPWIVDVEYANELAGGNEIRIVKRTIQKCLASKHCKKIIPWSDWAKRTLHRSINCKPFKDKIETVHFGVRPKNLARKRDSGRVKLLFVGSVNLYNALNFEGKGGIEVIEAFQKLRQKYDRIELVIRSMVPYEIKVKYSKSPGTRILDSPISDEALAELYLSSDICVFPAHYNLGMAILEAMSYELPVVARSIYDVPEAVKDMKTGLLLPPMPNLRYYTWNGAPNCYDRNFLKGVRKHRRELVDQIVQKTSLLIEDSSLRRRLGREARISTENGEFSVSNRNKKLKRIFDEATDGSLN
jgi:glycosyltransferase involved in cell wall biosynthesis